jgi:hypothetical protein
MDNAYSSGSFARWSWSYLVERPLSSECSAHGSQPDLYRRRAAVSLSDRMSG